LSSARRDPHRLKIAVLCQASAGRADGIRDHALGLVDAVQNEGHVADLRARTDTGSWRSLDGSERQRLTDGLGDYDAVLLEYNPFMYGRWGFAPWLPVAFARLRLHRRRPRIVVAVHEPFVRATGVRTLVMAVWQRAQLFALRAEADVLLVTVEAWARELEGWRPSRPTRQLPSGSALPDRRAGREAARIRIGAASDAIVVATFSSGHPSHRDDLVTGAVAQLASTRPVILLALGARQAPSGPPGVRIVAPGYLPAEEVAELLAAADLFLAPLVDGVSNRRTSVLAALQQGVAVIGTNGPLTDSSLATSEGIALAPVGDSGAFCALAARFSDEAGERAALAAAGRALYEERYAPRVLARIVIDACRA